MSNDVLGFQPFKRLKPWISERSYKLLTLRSSVRLKMLNCPGEESRSQFRSIVREVQRSIRTDKRLWIAKAGVET